MPITLAHTQSNKKKTGNMYLTKVEEAVAGGKYGSGVQKCMDILTKLAGAFGAKGLVKVTSAHTVPKEPPEFFIEMKKSVDWTGTF